MKAKKITAVFFILVLALQLLPVKQAIKYFFTDNPLVEELVAHGKSATKNFRFLDEDHHSMHGLGSTSFYLSLSTTHSSFLFAEMLPALYTSEILTPPPNNIVLI